MSEVSTKPFSKAKQRCVGQAHRRQHVADLLPQRLGMYALTSNQDHEIVRITDETHDRVAGAPMPSTLPLGAQCRPLRGEVLI